MENFQMSPTTLALSYDWLPVPPMSARTIFTSNRTIRFITFTTTLFVSKVFTTVKIQLISIGILFDLQYMHAPKMLNSARVNVTKLIQQEKGKARQIPKYGQLYSKFRERASCSEFCVLSDQPRGQDGPLQPARDCPFRSRNNISPKSMRVHESFFRKIFP